MALKAWTYIEQNKQRVFFLLDHYRMKDSLYGCLRFDRYQACLLIIHVWLISQKERKQ